MTWKTDQEMLRTEIKNLTEGGLKATMRYVLLSHMRGRIHMRYYDKYHGGWRHSKTPEKGSAPKEFKKAYGDDAQYYYARSVIETLEDQAVWIVQFLDHFKLNDDLNKLAKRVLDGYNVESARVA